MSKYSSDSNSRDRTRSYSRYNNKRHRSSSSSSTDNSRYSRKNNSSRSESRHHKSSKHRHRSNSSSEYSSSRHKYSSRSHRKNESRSKRKHHRRSSSTSYESNNSNSSHKNDQAKNSKPFNENEKNKNVQPNLMSTFQDNLSVVKSETVNNQDSGANWLQENVLDVVKRENSIEQINQEGFVVRVFQPSSEQKEEDTIDKPVVDVPKINEVIDNYPTDKLTILVCNGDKLLNAKYKLLTKQERCITWAKQLIESYNQSEHNDEQFVN